MKKVVKLFLALSLLTGSLIVALPKEASAYCESYCCDPNCDAILRCFQVGSSCVCEEYCVTFGPDPDPYS